MPFADTLPQLQRTVRVPNELVKAPGIAGGPYVVPLREPLHAPHPTSLHARTRNEYVVLGDSPVRTAVWLPGPAG